MSEASKCVTLGERELAAVRFGDLAHEEMLEGNWDETVRLLRCKLEVEEMTDDEFAERYLRE